ALFVGAGSAAQSATNAAPAITVPGASLTAKATSARGAVISYIAAATDDVAPVRIDCAPQSGAVFSIGTTTVQCIAADACGATNAFLNELGAQTGKHIDEARAQELLSALTDIRAALGCIQSTAAPVLFAPAGDIATATAPHLPTARVLYAATVAGAGVVV